MTKEGEVAKFLSTMITYLDFLNVQKKSEYFSAIEKLAIIFIGCNIFFKLIGTKFKYEKKNHCKFLNIFALCIIMA